MTPSRLKRVQRFSESLNIDPSVFVAAGVLDPVLGVDVKMFVDPQLLLFIDIPEFRGARAKLEKYFEETFKLIAASSAVGDRPHRTAVSRLTFKEVKGVGIGFGRDTDDGRGIGRSLAARLVNSAAEIQRLGKSDPAIFELLGLFEEDFGPDRLSDLTLLILREEFLAFTERVSREMRVPFLRPYMYREKLYHVPFRNEHAVPVTLLPLGLLRDLPIATDPSEITEASSLNEELREYWRDLLAQAFKAGKAAPDKASTKEMFLENPDFFNALIRVYREQVNEPYDFVRDPKGLLNWVGFARDYAARFPLSLSRDIQSLEDLDEVVRQIIEQFRRNIEDNGLNKLLFNHSKRPHREAYSQLLFFASADAYCRANGLDLSPESNAGRGPVDFKISRGTLKVVVEMKLSRHKKLLHGFQEQMNAYRKSESAQRAYYVIVKVSDPEPEAIKTIRHLISRETREGRQSNRLVVIDGTIQPSASKG